MTARRSRGVKRPTEDEAVGHLDRDDVATELRRRRRRVEAYVARQQARRSER